MPELLTDEEKERIALQVEHLEPEKAQEVYERRCELLRTMKQRRHNAKQKQKANSSR